MANVWRQIGFLKSVHPHPYLNLSALTTRSLTTTPRRNQVTSVALPIYRRFATVMRYGCTALLVILVSLFATSPSVRATEPLFRKSGSAGPSNSEFVTAFSTVPSEKIAQTISDDLVSSKLVACVNTIPGITSTYWWEGKVQRDTELLLMIKTTTSLVPQVIERIRTLHPYDVPEVIVQPIIAGHKPYLQWIAESTSKGDSV